ncbi:hypothetical protein [Nocardioides sp. BYT-33-1]|uniref:hypothetical protein n=1 Tax=Nocardioides sp. BYT-33-1 TaxID=3416952 RepID=UPI003F52ECA1
MRRSRILGALTAAALLVASPAAAQPMEPENPEDPGPVPGPIDRTPPTINIDYPTGGVDGWFPGPRTVPVLVVDQGTGGGASSGVGQVSYTMTGATEHEEMFEGHRGSIPVSNEGSTQIDIVAVDGNGNRADARIWVGIDRVAPTITFAGHLGQGAEYALGQRVLSGFSCWDGHSGVATCNGSVANGAPLNTSTPGTRTLVVTTTDPVGNARQATLTYHVRRGTFTVQQPPTISGAPRVGETLTATPATFAPEPTAVEHRWYRNGSVLTGFDEPTYTVRPQDAGSAIHYASVPVLEHHDGVPATSSPLTIAKSLEADGPARITGEARVGGLLTAVAPGVTEVQVETLLPERAGGDTHAYQWLRDGQPIAGATAATYRPGAADAGRSLSVRLTVQRPQFEPLTLQSAGTAPVARAAAQVVATAKPKARGKVKVKVAVTAPVLADGTVVVRRGKKVVGTAVLKDGRATLVLRKGLPRGKVRLTVAYGGSTAVEAAGATVRAKVR